MAPIFSTAIGVTPQIIDDPRLRDLITSLHLLDVSNVLPASPQQNDDDIHEPLDIVKLVKLLEPYQVWMFEEQVDLHEWIHPLNAIDAALNYFIHKYPSLLLIGPVKRKRGRGSHDSLFQPLSRPAESVRDVSMVPATVVNQLCVIMRFLCGLLRNAASKLLFNSVEELVDFLAAVDDTLASLALEALCNLAAPPSLHKQQSPEVNQHTTALHNSKTASHRRLIALARGWGTRGSGLGLYTCVTADDSEFGQGSLPCQAGELDFSFSSSVEKAVDHDEDDNHHVDTSDFQLVRVHLATNEVIEDISQADLTSTTGDVETNNLHGESAEVSKKRRRVGPVGSKLRPAKSTAELFFLCLERAGGRQRIPTDRLFALLADIRLARDFHSHTTRVKAVERRIRALITILHAHPSEEIMSGYFQAQPELCVELIDLLRPTVSSSNVSAASARPKEGYLSKKHAHDALGALANSPGVPYTVRMLAVEALAAFVARRDGSSGALAGSARHSSVLHELGVAKGQYLGLLPTLIRYSLASLGSSFSKELSPHSPVAEVDTDSTALTLDIGFSFVEAVRLPQPPRIEQLERALEFIDAVLTLTSAIVSTPTGTSALTDCGLIPALLNTASMDSQAFIESAFTDPSSISPESKLRLKSLLRFITAQAVQILEGAIVTNSNALSAFHDLQGVEVLTSRLSREVGVTRGRIEQKKADPDSMDCDVIENKGAEVQEITMPTEVETVESENRILSSQRVLLFSIVTCLTVVFHQESTSSSVTAPSGGTQLRKPELTQALIDIMNDVNSYGGHLASLIATLLSDVLNSDPHVVHHVHECGLATAFLDMVLGEKITDNDGRPRYEPILPPVPELIMPLPNAICALALTENGAKAVKDANPFPSLLRLFHHPNYAMPKSRCLLNEMTAVVGTGLDEVMRHVNSLKPLVLEAIVKSLNEIVKFAEDLTRCEESSEPSVLEGPSSPLENERSCLMQYVLNFGHLLEQILHNEDHCGPFVDAGGLDALLQLFPAAMPKGFQFLSHVSSLSCPSISTLHHSTAEKSLSIAFKCISLRYDPLKLLQKVLKTVEIHLDNLEVAQGELRELLSSKPGFSASDASFVLQGLTRQPVHRVNFSKDGKILKQLSKYLGCTAALQWITNLLGGAIKTACQRNQESGTGWNRAENEWRKLLSSKSFEELVGRLTEFHQTAIFEVCRIRTQDEFEHLERSRLSGHSNNVEQICYRIRIVCAEGAVVRDGIEIDSCASVGSMEMGEVVVAFDRCVNSSGILRYRTQRGWVSEMTRGRGREPIAEVISFWKKHGIAEEIGEKKKGRIEASVPDLCSVSASIMARLQTSYAELLNALSRTVIQGVRSLSIRTVALTEGNLEAHVATLMRIVSSNVEKGFNHREVRSAFLSGTREVNDDGITMYMGSLLAHLNACLFEEKRERRMVNIPLLAYLLKAEHESIELQENESPTYSVPINFIDAASFIFRQSLGDFEQRSKAVSDRTGEATPHQRVGRTIAASLPAAIALLRKLMSGPLISSSPAASVLSRIKRSDIVKLVGKKTLCAGFKKFDSDEALFSPEMFMRSLYLSASNVVLSCWRDPRFLYTPPHIVHPLAILVGDMMVGLEDASKKKSSGSSSSRGTDSSQWNLLRGSAPQRRRNDADAGSQREEVFEPTEDAITRLTEMGFTRDHALDALESTQSNRVEIAMEYALAHPPSLSSIERRRAEWRRRREERRQRANDNQESEAARLPAASTETNSEDSAGAMDVEQDDNMETGKEGKDEGDEDIMKAKEMLRMWITEASRVSCCVLAAIPKSAGIFQSTTEKGKSEGDGEGEALTVVLSSFLLDLCQRYPDEKRNIVTLILRKLKSCFSPTKAAERTSYRVIEGCETSLASLCHATVLFTRALPKTRALVLSEGLVTCLVNCAHDLLKLFLSSQGGPNKGTELVEEWPTWLAPVLLLLDVMAQPVVAFAQQLEVEDSLTDKEGELSQVRDEHKAQAHELSETANKIFAAMKVGKLSAPDDEQLETDQSGLKGEKADASGSSGDGGSSQTMQDQFQAASIENPFSNVPGYFPLMPSECVESCFELCLDVLRSRKNSPPAGVVHACLSLLLRLLRTPKLSSNCLQMGAAEAILSLPKECRFTGNTGIVTLILRRLLEDEIALQGAMETEIRGTVTKLHAKRKDGQTDDEIPFATQSAFTQAVIPLLCRDPLSFLKALLLSVKVETDPTKDLSTSHVTLLSQEERANNLRLLSDVIKPKKTVVGISQSKSSNRRRNSSVGRPRRGSGAGINSKSKSPSSSRRSSSTKKNRKQEEKGMAQTPHTLNGTPSNHITCLLISQVVSSYSLSEGKDKLTEEEPFLSTANLLEILADLVLAVPACASVVHKYRNPRWKERSCRADVEPLVHALSSSVSPPKTFISFLLHTLLPQDRWSIKNDQMVWERAKDAKSKEAEAIIAKRKHAIRLNRVAQTSARLLVTLVARPGEGRRRVISELTYALSGGFLPPSTAVAGAQSINTKTQLNAREFNALQAWGELCTGLAAPRSNGKNPDGNSSLSFEVVKLMLEFGMAHALLYSIRIVRFHHPMAPTTCGALLLPLEILTRGSVTDAVQAIAEKENSARGQISSIGTSKEPDTTNSSKGNLPVHGERQLQSSDGLSTDEVMLEVAFHEEIQPRMLPQVVDGYIEDGSGNVDEYDILVQEDDRPSDQEGDDNEDDVEMEEDNDDEDSEASNEDDEAVSSRRGSDSEATSEVDNSDEDTEGEEDDDEDGSIMEEDSEGASSEEMEEAEESDWNINYREELVHESDIAEGETDGDEMDRDDNALDDGWTRLESNGFDGMLLGRGSAVNSNAGPMTARTRGLIDAAEAMIGTLLRTGEIHGDALAEIEGSLGIRIMSNGRSIRTVGTDWQEFAEPSGGRRAQGDTRSVINQGRTEVVGTLPHIQQRSQPGVGYSALSAGGRWIESNSMEYVYGGLSVTTGSRNYDLISPAQSESETEAYPNISQLDLHLFPGGPASAAHARTQHSLHPLLCGVELPPINSLVSDLLPHGIRSTRPGAMTTRRPGEWTNSSTTPDSYFVLTSDGNIIRSNRSQASGPLSLGYSNRVMSGSFGWTDDGLPFDATVAEFSSAFERALRDSISVVQISSERNEERERSSRVLQMRNGSEAPSAANEHSVERNQSNQSAISSQVDTEENVDNSRMSENGSPEASTAPSNDGDGVASSLAAGLRLSPRSESSAISDPMSTGNTSEEPASNQTSLQQNESNGDTRGTNQSSSNSHTGEEGQATEQQSHTEDAEEQPRAEQEQQDVTVDQEQRHREEATANGVSERAALPNANGLICPPNVDEEVFNSLPIDMQRDCVQQHRVTEELAAQLDAGSSLDPEALAALPEELRREVIQQDQQDRRIREQAQSDPANAEDMDNASFLASLAPDLREEILLTSDEAFLSSLPTRIRAEAQVLRERHAAQHRRIYDDSFPGGSNRDVGGNMESAGVAETQPRNRNIENTRENGEASAVATARKKPRAGKLRVDRDREQVLYIPPGSSLPPPIASADVKSLLRLLYLLSPIRPARLLQKVFQNLCTTPGLRLTLTRVLVRLLHEDNAGAIEVLDSMKDVKTDEIGSGEHSDSWISALSEFPPTYLLGAVPEMLDTEGFNPNISLLRRRQGSNTAASIAANLPGSAGSRHEQQLSPIVATRIVDTLLHLSKSSPKFCLHSLESEIFEQSPGREQSTCFDKLLDLLERPRYLKSSANLEQLLSLLEATVTPLSHLSKHGEETLELSQREIDSAVAAGKEWREVPRVTVSQARLQLLCSILRMETCRDAAFTKVNTIVRRLCRVDANRGYVLAELASVAHALGADAVRDLKALRIRMDEAVIQQLAKESSDSTEGIERKVVGAGGASSAVTLSSSTSELKLLRVLQTLQALCSDTNDEAVIKKQEVGAVVTEELVQLLHAMKLDALWDELTACLKVVQVLEGVSNFQDEDGKESEGDTLQEASGDENSPGGKKLKNSAAGLLTRFLASVEAFFVANASVTRETAIERHADKGSGDVESGASRFVVPDESNPEKLVGGTRLVEFVGANRVLLNALVRNNPVLLDRGLKALVKVPRCRVFLDFDVKRQWFKTQVRRLRQQASRRHGSLRLHIRRKHVFEDAYHQLRLRNAEEMRGRLHITFRNEEGVDAGGLSREFFGILAKEIFNPDYALFTSTEDGCTFQPNPNSSINPDHLSYFRFVGRIVGKAVADGFLLDTHFTRSLYKHMLGLKPTHHDMEAIDPDYYRNLKTILEYSLADIGLDLTFSIEDHSFGRSQVIDLIKDGRNVHVPEERKAEYVKLVCQHRMTDSISSQIKAYLDGFYELVSPQLIAIFTPRELELLISGLPDIDVHNLKENTDYVGWKATDKEIEWFWNVMFSLSRNEKAAFLQFVTGSSKVPLAGFSELQGMRGVQKFSIHKTTGSSGALMSAHTCFNSLDLPTYQSEDELRGKLLYAINEGVGSFMFA